MISTDTGVQACRQCYEFLGADGELAHVQPHRTHDRAASMVVNAAGSQYIECTLVSQILRREVQGEKCEQVLNVRCSGLGADSKLSNLLSRSKTGSPRS